jgi:hypothetical protein
MIALAHVSERLHAERRIMRGFFLLDRPRKQRWAALECFAESKRRVPTWT